MLDACRNTNGTTVHVQYFETEEMWQYNHECPDMGPAGAALKQPLMAATKALLLTHIKCGGGGYSLIDTPEILFRSIAAPMIR